MIIILIFNMDFVASFRRVTSIQRKCCSMAFILTCSLVTLYFHHTSTTYDWQQLYENLVERIRISEEYGRKISHELCHQYPISRVLFIAAGQKLWKKLHLYSFNGSAAILQTWINKSAKQIESRRRILMQLSRYDTPKANANWSVSTFESIK